MAWLFLAAVLLTGHAALGGVTLPLGGACKPGRFFPVTVDAIDRETITADGCVPVDLAADNRRLTIPVLVTGVPGPVHFPGGSLPLHLAASDEILVGTTDPAIATAGLFAGRHVTAIGLDPADPLPGPAAAWETLDAVCLDPPSMARITDQARSTLLAAGVEIIARGNTAPDNRWPWVQEDQFWILKFHPAGPVDEIVNSDVYSPVSAWTPGRRPAVQTRIILMATLATLAVIAVCLWHSRWRMPVVVVILLLATGSIVIWRQTLDVAATGGGDVLVVDGPLVQHDTWVFQRGLDTGDVAAPFTGWTHPVFSSTSAMNNAGLRMTVTPTTTAFTATTGPDRLLAFVHRDVLPEPPPATTAATPSVMQDIAKAVYAGPGFKLSGDGPTAAGRWNTAVVGRGK
jgi:hypothetical protein